MLRLTTAAWLCGAVVLAGCGGSGYVVRPVPRIAADTVGKPVSVLQEAFGEPRKIDKTSTKLVYVWFLPQKPKEGAPSGFQGCEMEVTVDAARFRLFVVEHRILDLRRCATAHPRGTALTPNPFLATIGSLRLPAFCYPKVRRRCYPFQFFPC
jgi:hypothetical protein